MAFKLLGQVAQSSNLTIILLGPDTLEVPSSLIRILDNAHSIDDKLQSLEQAGTDFEAQDIPIIETLLDQIQNQFLLLEPKCQASKNVFVTGLVQGR